MAYALSPNNIVEDIPTVMSLDRKIDVFADRVRGWQLDIAQQCADNIKHSGFAVLHIICSYFEMIAKYKEGITNDKEVSSRRYFKKGFKEVFPALSSASKGIKEKQLEKLYNDVRCGLYHAGITGPGILLSGDYNFPVSFAHQDNKVQINPQKLVLALIEHFSSYIRQLCKPKNIELRRNFEARFDIKSVST